MTIQSQVGTVILSLGARRFYGEPTVCTTYAATAREGTRGLQQLSSRRRPRTGSLCNSGPRSQAAPQPRHGRRVDLAPCVVNCGGQQALATGERAGEPWKKCLEIPLFTAVSNRYGRSSSSRDRCAKPVTRAPKIHVLQWSYAPFRRRWQSARGVTQDSPFAAHNRRAQLPAVRGTRSVAARAVPAAAIHQNHDQERSITSPKSGGMATEPR